MHGKGELEGGEGVGEDGNWRWEVDVRSITDGFTKEDIRKGCRHVALVLKMGISDNCASSMGKSGGWKFSNGL